MFDALMMLPLEETEPKTNLLMHFNGANNSRTTVDETGKPVSFSGGSVSALSLTTARSKFGSASLRISGPLIIRHVLINNQDALPFGQSDFTIDFWLFSSSGTAGGSYSVFSCDFLNITHNPGVALLGVQATGLNISGTLPGNQWVHVRIVRHGGRIYLFTNGILRQSAAWNPVFAKSVVRLFYSTFANENFSFETSIDELRISNVARGITNFEIPTAPYVLD